jgi:hypothetical protein
MVPFARAPCPGPWQLACRHSTFVREDIDLVISSEAVDTGKIVIDDHDASSSLHSPVLGKAFVFGRIACPMRSVPTPLGWRLWEFF